MAWEKRGNSNQYFYRCKRLPDGRVHKQYFGRGLRAEAEAIEMERKARERDQERIRRSKLHNLDLLARECMKAFMLILEAHLYAAGYHNPKSRGWRKRRSAKMIKQMDCGNADGAPVESEPSETVSEEVTLEEVIRRCRSGDRNAVITLRRVMQDHPDLFSNHGHITAKVQSEWIRAISGPDLFEREMMLKNTRELRQGLIGEGSGTHLERLAAEQVVTSHLEQGFHQLIEARCVGKGIDLPKYQVDASQRATRRHEKALSALTTIRTLTPKMASETALLPEEPQDQATGQVVLEANRLSAVFDRCSHPVPMN